MRDKDFRGKVAVVSGAGSGIGLGIARSLAEAGTVTVLVDRDGVAARSAADQFAAAGLEASALEADVSIAAIADRAVADVENNSGPIDFLVNAAGVLRLGTVADTTDEDWRYIFSVNADGVFQLSRAVVRYMIPRRRGVIVTVASNAACVPRVNMAAYGASKAAASSLTKSLALEVAGFGIRCNVVSPGSTDTPMLRSMWTGGTGPEQTIAGDPDAFRVAIPLRKIAQPSDIAEAVMFLLSERAGHITMQELCVDGGAALGA